MPRSSRYLRLPKLHALAFTVAAATGCSMQTGAPGDMPPRARTEQFISTPLATAPTFSASTGRVTVTMAGEVAEIYVNAGDSSLMVNGVQAVDTSTAPPTIAYATGRTANVKALLVQDATNTGDVLILNYINGLFGLGSRTTIANPPTSGTYVNMKSGGSNTLVLKGTPAADSFAIGPSGLSLTNGSKNPTLDVATANVDSFDVLLGDGNDAFTSNATVTGGVFVNPVNPGNGVHVFGGNGDDTLIEGAVPTPYETFSGGPGNDTVDYSARGAKSPLTGSPTFRVTGGSPVVTATGSRFTKELAVGQDISFSSQPGVTYVVSAITSDTSLSLSESYTGPTSTTVSAAGGNPVTVTIDASGRATSGSGVGTPTALAGAAGYSVTHGTTGVTNAAVFGGALAVGSVVTFDSQPGVGYAIAAIAGNGQAVTLATSYTGPTSTSASATLWTHVADCAVARAALEQDVILDAEIVKGTPGNDQLMGDVSGAATLNGNAGDDVFCEGDDAHNGGSDTLVGGGGADTVDYSLRTATLVVVLDGRTKSGDATANSSSGENDVVGADVSNVRMGSGTGSVYTGNSLNNTFVANSVACGGSAEISGMDGNDTLDEGPDAASCNNETFHGGSGVDLADYHRRTRGLSLVMDGSTAGGDGSEQDVIDVDVENLYGGSGADSLTGNALDNDIEGKGGADTLCGMAGSDTLVGNPLPGAANATNLHGGDCADDPEPGVFNMCLNTGTTGTPASKGQQNCGLVTL